MILKPIQVVHVYYRRDNDLLAMGKLALKDHKIFFEYAQNFLELGLELSPFKLPIKPGVFACEDRLFEGLFGVFNDSLPDGWGRLLLDRKLAELGLNPSQLTPLDRLCHVGKHGMGALFYEPETSVSSAPIIQNDLDIIAEECQTFQENDDPHFIDHLLAMNGSSGGARPKILVSLFPQKKSLELTPNSYTADQEDWIIKFKSSLDPKDIGSLEYAYHLMAAEAGLDLPTAKLFPSQKCAGYFGVKRFDRSPPHFLHMHTASGLLHADHRIPSLDYSTLMKATLVLTKDIHECGKLFRQAIFNVLAHNRDDHAKNFSFLMDTEGQWRISPAYDLTFSAGPAGEHCTTLMGEGKNPRITHLLQLAQLASIPSAQALEMIEQTKAAISKWEIFAKEADVSKTSQHRIQSNLNRITI